MDETVKNVLWEVLEIAIHTLLYDCSLYPLGSFRRQRKYGIPIQVCVHPDVRLYIEQLLASAKDMVKESSSAQIRFLVLLPSNAIIRRYVFDVVLPTAVNPVEADEVMVVEQMIRKCLLNLSTSASNLTPLPPDCSWSVELSTKWSSVVSQQHNQTLTDFQWIPNDSLDNSLPDCHIVPVSVVDMDSAKMQVYIEEVQRQ